MKTSRSIPILFVSLVIVMLGFGIAIPLMPFYVIHFNASGSALGLMMALYSFMQFLFAPFWGQLSDRYGRKPILLIGVTGFFVSFMAQGLAQDIFQFIIFRTLAGFLSSATLPAAMAYIADITSSQDRAKGVGMMGAAMGLGMVLGPALGGLLSHLTLPLPQALAALLQVTTDATTGETINLSIPFFVSALLALLALPPVHLLLPESLPVDKRQTTGAVRGQVGSNLGAMLAGLRGSFGFLYILAFLLAFALANMESVLALYGAQRFEMGPSEIGLLMAGIGLLSVIQQGVMIGPLTRRYGEVKVIRGGLALGIIGFVGMAMAPVKWLMIVAALVFNLGNVLLQPSVTALISRRARGGQGAVMGLNNSFQSLGRAIGPLWAGMAFDIYNTLSFWTGALIQFIALVYSLRVLSAAGEAEVSQPAASTEQ